MPSTGHLDGIGRGCFKWKLLSAWRRQNWRSEAFSFQQWLNFARVCIASLSVPCCGFLFLVWMLAIGNHDCSLSEQCFEWHSSGECWNIGEIIISNSCKTFFTPKDTEKPAQLWTMRVQLRIGANPFIKLAQIPQADRSVQCGDFWPNRVSLDLLSKEWIWTEISSLLLTLAWFSLWGWSSTMVSQSHGGSPNSIAWIQHR